MSHTYTLHANINFCRLWQPRSALQCSFLCVNISNNYFNNAAMFHVYISNYYLTKLISYEYAYIVHTSKLTQLLITDMTIIDLNSGH